MDEAMDLDTLRDSVRDVLDTECPLDRVLKQAARDDGILAPLWNTVSDLGWTALAIAEVDGGLGLGIAALVPLYEELGRVVAPLPFASTMLVADAIGRSGDAVQRERWLPRIASGAVAALSDPTRADEPLFTIATTGDDIMLSGRDDQLLDASDAELVLLLARDGDGGLFRVIVEPHGDTVPVGSVRTWDHGHGFGTIDLASLRLPADRAIRVSAESEAALVDHAALALAAEAIGGSQALLAMTIEYLKTRRQFDKPIGSFQALKHRIADHRTRLEGDRLLVRAAARLGAGNAGSAAFAAEASAAKAQACANYANLARDAIQLHGGIGFTAEHACHLFLKRARLNEAIFGRREYHLSRAFATMQSAEAA